VFRDRKLVEKREDAPKHDDRPPVVVIKIYAFRDLASGDRKQNGAPAIITSLFEG
jgi:hypothetical protein